ncbi:MAG: hypothetical protein K2R98_30895 [Gemmataceae bacterium]|nr:hypothetical protein [Gemmataceae bacterium]
MSLEPIKQEIATYLRELPRLLADGNEGKFALVKGDEVVSVWDTFDDACEAGYAQFGIDRPFLAQPIDSRDQRRPFPSDLVPGRTA